MMYACGAALTPAVLLLLLSPWTQSSRTGERARPLEYVGNEACSACHRRIYESYSSTAMARTSGPALPNVIEGSFDHGPSGVSYQVGVRARPHSCRTIVRRLARFTVPNN